MRFIHWLVVQTRADDIKRCHGDGHGHSTDHGSHQSNEPAVWTEPLDRDTLIVNRSSDLTSLSLHKSQGEGNGMPH